MEFFDLFTSGQLLAKTESLLPAHRERLYPPLVTLSMFMKQVLQADDSCQKAVNSWAVSRIGGGLGACSANTGAYCKARQRLPLSMVSELARETGRQLCARSLKRWRWGGRTVKLVDGSGISMPDTAQNQARFPQSSNQAEGVGFPQARIVVVLCLASGALVDAAMCPFEGKGNSEVGLLRQLTGAFEAGDVMLADSIYCNYFLIATMQQAGVDVVFQQHGRRITNFRRGQRLSRHDHVVAWPKPKDCPHWMTQQQYQAFPAEILVREAQVDGQILVTTLLAPASLCKQELSKLYGLRWNVELDLRNIKTTLGMDVLSCTTPQMNEKELWVHLLAYNVIRLLMAQAACQAGIQPREVSFKHTVQVWSEWTAQRAANRLVCELDALLDLIAQIKVGRRPGRLEPRARKRRPKPYPWLHLTRAQARQQVRTHGHL
jgi:hypothetical protein